MIVTVMKTSYEEFRESLLENLKGKLSENLWQKLKQFYKYLQYCVR